jgi:Rieske Fe-S protein
MTRCDGPCEFTDRRDFLRRTTMAIGAIMAGLAASPREATALPLSLVRALQSRGEELTYPIPTADGATIDDHNEVIVVRFNQAVYAFNLSCPHQNTALRWLAGDGRFQCPKHKSKYQPDGSFISGRATRNMDRFAVRREGDHVVVNVATLIQSDTDAARWNEARVVLAPST